MVAISEKNKKGGFLRPLKSFDDLLGGRPFMMVNGDFIFKNGNGYVIADVSADREFTADDYMKLPEGAPFQLIHGKLTYMPSPKDKHQAISFQLSGHFFVFLNNHPIGIVRHAPMDVHLDEKNIFQPDLLFVTNERKEIIKDWIFGAPDLVVEIISKGSEKDDRERKMEVYGKHNVLEYWLISPENQQVEVFENKKGKLVLKAKLTATDTLTSKVLPGLKIPLGSLFQ
jgi:Uma2 family endonuclease